MEVKEVVWRNVVLSYFFRFFYITGLTLIIPYLFTSDIPEEFWFFSNLTQETFLYISIGLIVISLIGMFWAKGNLGRALRSMGYMTLIPGGIAMIVALYGEQVIMRLFEGFAWFEKARPVIGYYLLHSVPKLWMLTISYIVIGVVLFFVGRRMKK